MKPNIPFLCALVIILLSAAPRARAQSPMGNALLFGGNGASGYVVVSNFGNIIPTSEITVEFWADVTASASDCPSAVAFFSLAQFKL